jgi:hypothetical protein
MAPLPSTETYDAAARAALLEHARRSIVHGVEHGEPVPTDVAAFDATLGESRACFVTLRSGGALRGCVGSLEARGPLVREVARCAHRAAFGDPRFLPLTRPELDALEVHISVLSPAVPIICSSLEELVAQLRPGIDGVTVRDGRRVGTFLPDVWEQLPTAGAFLGQLWAKAGLAPGHWSSALVVERYTTEGF